MSDPSDANVADANLDNCGCCETEPPETPIFNPPGQPQLSYRIDTQPTFLQRMLDALPRQTVPPATAGAPTPLQALTTRELDDPSIALLDAWAVVADVFTFYQERIANEGFLRTATEQRSVLELAREIGYELSPGVAASVDLAFTVENAAGSPSQVNVPVGTRVMSVPGQGQTPQTFETIEAIVARPEWNDLPVRVDDPEQVLPGMTDLFLDGTSTHLNPGDALLFLGASREVPSQDEMNLNDPNWDVRVLIDVEPDNANQRTRVTWEAGLVAMSPAKVFAFRKRAGLFGHNAPLFQVLPDQTKVAFGQGTTDKNGTTFQQPTGVWDWPNVVVPLPNDFDLTNKSLEFKNNFLDLDINDPKITNGSWLALASAENIDASQVKVTPAGTFSGFPQQTLLPPPFPLSIVDEPLPVEQTVAPAVVNADLGLFQVKSSQIVTRAEFALTGTATRVSVDSGLFPSGIARRTAQFYVESQQLALGRRPVLAPVDGKEELPEIAQPPDLTALTGSQIALGQSVLGLTVGQKLMLSGKRPNIHVVDAETLNLRLTAVALAAAFAAGQDPASAPSIVSDLTNPDNSPNNIPGTFVIDGAGGDVEPLTDHLFELLEPPAAGPFISDTGDILILETKTLRIRSRTGATGTINLPFLAFDLIPAAASGEDISETVVILAVFQGSNRMLIQLKNALQLYYDRPTLQIFANVASATNGATVANETLGSGDATVPNQTFTLMKPPTTYVTSADSPTGAVSTVTIRVNGVLWREVPILFGQGPDDQVYILRQTDDGHTSVIFGDGTTGARLPTGTANVVATYRAGIGLAGDVDAGSLTLLVTRPLGTRAVTNPLAATGAEDPASIADSRKNAPLTVRTLDRVVSVSDVQDYSSSFAGIGKAQALLVWNGTTRLVHLTVGGADGKTIPSTSPVLTSLLAEIQNIGDPSLLLQIETFNPLSFSVVVQVDVDPRLVKQTVLDAVTAALVNAFSFAERDFGQSVNSAEVVALVQNVPGVIAANVASLLDQNGDPQSEIVAQLAHFDVNLQAIVTDDLLTIDPTGITLMDLTP